MGENGRGGGEFGGRCPPQAWKIAEAGGLQSPGPSRFSQPRRGLGGSGPFQESEVTESMAGQFFKSCLNVHSLDL